MRTVMVGKVFLGQYQAIRLLGEGGMGQVFFGRQLSPPREVVVKVMHPHVASRPRFEQTFQQEATLMTRLRHPHIVQLLDAGVDDQAGPCLILEYLAGTPLETLRRRQRRFEPDRVGRWLVQVCSALHAAHAAGIVHRDLKPENLMVLDADTESERIKVMDFGLAQMAAVPHFALDKLNGTCRHIGGGTPDYLPPEQVRRDPVDHRGDIYSLGVMLFQLLTGRLPFTGRDVADVLVAHAEQPPPRFSDALPGHGIAPAVEAVVQACLAKYPNERPQSVRALAERWEKAVGERLLEPGQFEPVAPSAPIEVASPVAAPPHDRNAVVHQLEAWMPESIAVVKLRGFAEDNGGQVVESVPGMIRLRFRDAAAPPARRPGIFSLFGRETTAPARATMMELHMKKKPEAHQTVLQVTVILRPEGDHARTADTAWQELAHQRFRTLRSYLMGRG